MRLVRIWVGLVLLVLGILGVLDATGVLDAGSAVSRWWPVGIIGLGVAAMISQRAVSLGAAAVAVFGGILLIDQQNWMRSDLVGPAILILIGLVVLGGLSKRWHGDHLGSSEPIAIFGGVEVKDRSEHLTRADVSAVFGGATLDLRDAHIDNEATVNAMALFGGAEVLVPKGWRVSMRGLPIFGAFEDKTGNGSLGPDAPVLKVNATAVFGGVDVAHEAH